MNLIELSNTTSYLNLNYFTYENLELPPLNQKQITY